MNAERPRGAGAVRRRWSTAAVLAAAMLLAFGCAGRGGPDLFGGDPRGSELGGLVDSEPARRLLADLLARRPPDPRLAAMAPTLLGSARAHGRGTLNEDLDRLPDQARLRELGLEVSMDFAALAFARAIGADERSRTLQAAFEGFVLDGTARSEESLRRPGAFPYSVLFAPAWLYRSHPENGGDFARQRRLLDRLGIVNRLVASVEGASVEDNAETIAAAVREAAGEGRGLILVSTSKSGPEVALALSRLMTPAEAAGVVGWLNVGGVLRGTPLADAALRPPASWLTRAFFWLRGHDLVGLVSMSTGPSRERLQGARLPDSIAVVNLVAVPLSGSVGLKLRWSYEILREDGPNDGAVLLADAIWPGGVNLVALGADHFFASLQEDAYGLALMRAVDLAVRLHRARVWPVAESAGQSAAGSNTISR
jgi:hypothetical protein